MSTPPAQRIIVYWRDIPAQIIIKQGRKSAKRELSLRFTEAIDMAAMRTGAAETDDYLAEWRKGDPEPVGDDLEAVGEFVLVELHCGVSGISGGIEPLRHEGHEGILEMSANDTNSFFFFVIFVPWWLVFAFEIEKRSLTRWD